MIRDTRGPLPTQTAPTGSTLPERTHTWTSPGSWEVVPEKKQSAERAPTWTSERGPPKRGKGLLNMGRLCDDDGSSGGQLDESIGNEEACRGWTWREQWRKMAIGCAKRASCLWELKNGSIDGVECVARDDVACILPRDSSETSRNKTTSGA